MGRVSRLFDQWSGSGRAERMQSEHGRPVRRFLSGVRLGERFSFLDVGCGNGWVVRAMAAMPGCTRAVGMDVSSGMIRNARARSSSKKESYVRADIESWGTRLRFDVAFSMEAIYYAGSPEKAVRKIYSLLRPGGRFFCGTDFYAENKTTSNWPDFMDVDMHLMSRRQWRQMFEDAGFEARTRLVRDPSDPKRWKRELGTLFVTGTRPA